MPRKAETTRRVVQLAVRGGTTLLLLDDGTLWEHTTSTASPPSYKILDSYRQVDLTPICPPVEE